ncbi:hypothetical protein HY504_03065 [Candidatus Wolfebacteria bacterium]|nr:hypothetical protein [Candidatus Wolfebacteria bacterium]
MKYILLVASIAIFLTPTLAGAIRLGTIPSSDDIGVQASPAQSTTDLLGIVAGIVQVTYWIFFAIAVMILLLVAFEYLRSSGDPQLVKKAQDWLIYASISIVLGLVAVAASAIIRSFIERPGANF